MANEILILSGLRALRIKQIHGEELPSNWKVMAKKYLEDKTKMIALHNIVDNEYDEPIVAERRLLCSELAKKFEIKSEYRQSILRKSEAQYKEAKLIFNLLVKG